MAYPAPVVPSAASTTAPSNPFGSPFKARSRAAASSPATFSSNPQLLPGFDFRPALPADFLPTAVVTGDFNRDGKMDWVVANGGSNNLWLYLGNGDGTSALPTIISLAGQSPIGLATASLRGNGILDLIVAEPDSSTVEVFLGNGDGTFAPSTLYQVPDDPDCVAVADFNGDGHLDVLVGLDGGTDTNVAAMLPGDGSGSLGTPLLTRDTDDEVGNVVGIAVGDFNNDGKLDFVDIDNNIAGQSAFGVFVFLNAGDGTFTQGQRLDQDLSQDFTTAIAVGDLDEDGCLDVVSLKTDSTGLFWKGNCDGTFQNAFANPAAVFGAGDSSYAVQLVDVNNDGHLDVVTSGVNIGSSFVYGMDAGNLVTVLYGDGTGGLTPPKVFRGEPGMYSLAVADLNNDHHPDLVTANQQADSASVYLNDGSGGFGEPSGGYLGTITGGVGGSINQAFSNLEPFDFNGDSKLDLALIEAPNFASDPYEITVMLNDGTGHFGPPIRSTTGLFIQTEFGDYTFGDFRNTGKLDFVSVGSMFSAGSPYISFARGNGDGAFAAPVITTPSHAQGIVATGDFNGDGNLDIAVAGLTGNSNPSSQLAIFLGHGNGTFTPGQVLTFDSNENLNPGLIFTGDFNHDGKTDILVWDQTGSISSQGFNLYEFVGNGDGTFKPAKIAIPNLGFFALADVNNDGWPDVVELEQPQNESDFGGPPTFNIYLSKANGSFALTNSYTPYVDENFAFVFNKSASFFPGASPMLADFNGDGNIDIAAFQLAPGRDEAILQILLGNGDGTFTPSFTTFHLHNFAAPQTAFDVDGDGRADLVETDGLTSVYNIIKSVPGPTFQLRINTDPVVADKGGVTISLPFPASSSTSFTLAASDPAISVPAIVTIPAGSQNQSVPFTIGSTFNPLHVFSIQAARGGQTQIVYGMEATSQSPSFVFTAPASISTVPGAVTTPSTIVLQSVSGYASTIGFTCTGLPSGVTCHIEENPLSLDPATSAGTLLTIQVPANISLGTYPFTITANDGSITAIASVTLYVGDFSVSVSPTSPVATPGGNALFNALVTSIFNFTQSVTMDCSSLPAAASCGSFSGSSDTPASPATPDAFDINTGSLPVGNYPFTVTATTGSISHSVTSEFHVGDIDGSFSTSALTIDVGSTANLSITVRSINGLAGEINFGCVDPPIGISCANTGAPINLSANGSISGPLQISVQSQPGILASSNASLSSGFLLYIVITASLLVFFVASRSKRHALTVACALVLLVLLVSCGGSGGGGGGGNGGGGSGSSSVTVSLNVTATINGNYTKSLGTVKVTVP